jgi:tight adherence protein B
MQLLLPVFTFLIVAIVGIGILVLAGGGRKSIISSRLEAIEQVAKRGRASLDLHLLRDEALSDLPFLHRLLSGLSWSSRLQAFIAQAGLQIKAGRVLLSSVVILISTRLVFPLFYNSSVLASLAAVIAALVPFGYVAFKRSRRLRAFEKTFPDVVDFLSRSVRAGHPFTTALEMIATEFPQPVSGEFGTTFEEQSFGLPLRDTLLNLCQRVPLMDVRFLVTALLIQKETGGNLAEILDNLSHVMRERFKLLGEVRIRTAQGRLTAAILIALPPLMLLLMRTINPAYVSPLFNHPWGHYMLGGAALLQLVGAGLLWKIVSIEI